MKILLKNGNIYNGTGQPPFVGDVLIADERIIQVGSDIATVADRTIDCTGLCVAPGFIDAHSHNDFYIEKNPAEDYFAPFLKQGITTQITGNCGFSPFGVSAESPHRDKVGGGLFSAKNPGSFADFLHASQGCLHVNIAPLIGHGTVRIGISGNASDPLTQAQIDEMVLHVSEAMKAGAFGGSLGLMYEPGMYAAHEELVTFAKEVAKYDGILTVHPRACSKIALGYRPIFTKPHIELALDEVIAIAEEAGVKLHYSHLIHVGKATWNCCDRLLKKLHAHGITYDLYAFCHGGSVITVILPPWYLGMSPEKRKNKFVQFRLKLMINITRKLLGLDFDQFVIADMGEEYKAYRGKNIAALASAQGLSNIDMYIKLVELSHGKARIFIGNYNNEEIIQKLMRDELSMFMTDAWIEENGVQNHASFQCFPTFLLKAREAGLPLETIIHKMSGKTAERFGLHERGAIQTGNFADITVFDFEGLAVDLETPDARPKGIKHVLVNGNVVVDDEIYRPLACGQMILKHAGR